MKGNMAIIMKLLLSRHTADGTYSLFWRPSADRGWPLQRKSCRQSAKITSKTLGDYIPPARIAALIALYA